MSHEVNPPIDSHLVDPGGDSGRLKLLADEIRFCEAGAQHALYFLRTCSAAVDKLGTIEADRLSRAMNDAFEELRLHSFERLLRSIAKKSNRFRSLW